MDELRKCKVGVKEYYFHGWYQYSAVIDPSPMAGGHPGGAIQYPAAIVEDTGGKVIVVPAWEIKFSKEN